MNIHKILFSKIYLAVFLVFLFRHGYSQTNDIEYIIQKISTDYPGYLEKTQGIDFIEWAHRTAKLNSDDTFRALSKIVNFFNDRHLRIILPAKNIYDDSIECQKRKREMLTYLKKPSTNRREGFWINDYLNCIIGFKLTRSRPETFEAVVVETKNKNIIPGIILCKLTKDWNSKYFTEFRNPQTGSKIFQSSIFRNDTVFTTGAESKWKKIARYHDNYLSASTPVTRTATGGALDSVTYLLTIPINSESNLRVVDSILKKDSFAISRRENLIIDIRRNVGGLSEVFEPILPWIYTNPINRICGKLFLTDYTIGKFEKDFEKVRREQNFTPAEDSEANSIVKSMYEKRGTYWPPNFDTIKLPEVRANPKKVALIIDYGCQSAAELMILTFLQSSKVKVFGEHSMGAVDYLSFYPTETVSKKYNLYLPTSKRVFNKGGEIDGKGIYPTVELSDDIPDWVQYVNNFITSTSNNSKQKLSN